MKSHKTPMNVGLSYEPTFKDKKIQSLAVGGTVAAGKTASKLLSMPEDFQGDQLKEWSDGVRGDAWDAVTLIGQVSYLLREKVCNSNSLCIY